jgi:hypothetical protein
MTWQDDYYPGSSDYPMHEDDERAIALDPWADPAYVRDEDAE